LRRAYEFWIPYGETPESFQRMVSETLRLNRRSRFTGGNINAENRVLITSIWLRLYPTYAPFSICFGVSVSTVDRVLNSTWADLWEVCNCEMQWPTIPVWWQKRRHSSEMPVWL
jgi:hypothetical protein